MYMRLSYKVCLATAVTLAIGYSVVSAVEVESDITLVRGQLQVQRNNEWVSASTVATGNWLRSEQKDAIIKMSGVAVRLEPGTQVKLSADAGGPQISARNGRLFVKVDQATKCQITTANNQVVADESEFVLDAGEQERLYVLQGQAKFTQKAVASQPAAQWSKSHTLALDGTDIRVRSKKRQRFVQGEENRGRRIGEDRPPTRTPSPTASESPAYSPSASVSPSVSPSASPKVAPTASPSPPPQNTPAISEGGSSWPWIGGLLGAGGLGYALSQLGNDEPDYVFRPASP